MDKFLSIYLVLREWTPVTISRSANNESAVWQEKRQIEIAFPWLCDNQIKASNFNKIFMINSWLNYVSLI